MHEIKHHCVLAWRSGIGPALVAWSISIAFWLLAGDLIARGNSRHSFLYLGIAVVSAVAGSFLSFRAGRRARQALIKHSADDAATP